MSFSEAIDHAKKRVNDLGRRSRRAVLLGNGFSRAYGNDFSYQHLRDKIDEREIIANPSQLFDSAGSSDFETIIDQLEYSASLVSLYSSKKSKIAQDMRSDAQSIKQELVQCLSQLHPMSQRISPHQYTSTSKFLSHFSEIFTVNYDLLLYWCTFANNDDLVKAKKDGFRASGQMKSKLQWRYPERPGDQNVFYLHGAMHLYEKDGELCKLKNQPKRSILKQLDKNLERGLYPLVVTEGTRENKETRISQSSYLRYCHNRLTKLRGNLFIHGLSMNVRDDHLINSIAQAEKLENIYIGLFGDPCDEHDQIKARMKSLRRKHSRSSDKELRIHYYDSESAHLWK